MSSLSAQLNSLNNQKSSRKSHVDAVGRGYGFTANNNGNAAVSKQALFKATIVYESSKAASDVPTSLVRAKCFDCLKGLQDVSVTLSSFAEIIASPQTVNLERRLMTEEQNKGIDAKVEKLLLHLTPYLSTHPSTLNVLEYLIRRYSVHLRSPLPFLTCLLPHHETSTFQRALQLVNVAELPTFFFLRAYAANGATKVQRSVIARQCSRSDELLKIVLNLAETAAVVHLKDSDEGGKVAEGTSRVMSFVTAVVVEAINQQVKHSKTSTLTDLTVRTILPSLVSAVGDSPSSCGCPDFRGFGYVVTATLSKHCDMGTAMKGIVASAIVKGSLKKDSEFVERNEQTTTQAVDAFCDSILALSVLLYKSKDTDLDFPIPAFKLLLRHRLLPLGLGHATRQGFDLTTFVAGLLERCVQHLETKLGEKVVNLWNKIAGNEVMKPVFAKVAKNVSESIVLAYVASNVPEDSNCEKLLTVFHDIAPSQVDSGIALATANMNEAETDSVSELVERVLGVKIVKTQNNKGSMPPCVALESPEADVRKEAIKNISEALQKSLDEDMLDSLLHRFLADEDLSVATSAAKNYCTLAAQHKIKPDPEVAAACLEKWGLANLHPSSHHKNSKKNKPKTTAKLTALAVLALEVAGLSEMDNEALVTHVASHLPTAVEGEETWPMHGENFEDFEAVTLHAAAWKALGASGSGKKLEQSRAKALSLVKAKGNNRAAYAVIANGGGVIGDAVEIIVQGEGKEEGKARLFQRFAQEQDFEDITGELIEITNTLTSKTSQKQYDLLHKTVVEIWSSVEDGVWGVMECGSVAGGERCCMIARDVMATKAKDKPAKNKKAAKGKKSSKTSSNDVENAVIPALALLLHSDRTVRKQAVLFLEAAKDFVTGSLADLASSASDGYALELEIDASAMPRFLGNAVKDCKELLKIMEGNWCRGQELGLGGSVGGVLKAMEVAGDGTDELFPLKTRWENCGHKIFTASMEKEMTWSDSGSLAVRVVGRMMRGVAGDGSGGGVGVVMGGGRRKYSVSESSFVELPDSMIDAMKAALKVGGVNVVARGVVCQTMNKASWVDHVWSKLTEDTQLDFAKLLLDLRVKGEGTGGAGGVGGVFDGLMLGAGVIGLLESVDLSKEGEEERGDELLALTFLCEYIAGTNGKAGIVGQPENGRLVFKLLFNKLAILAKCASDDDDYAKNSVLSCLAEITSGVQLLSGHKEKENGNGSAKKKRRRSSSGGGGGGGAEKAVVPSKEEEKNFLSYSELLVGLLGGAKGIKAVEGGAVVRHILAVLTEIAEKCPVIARSLLPALQLVTERGERVDDVRSFQVSNDCLAAIVPSFCKGGRRAGMRFWDLVEVFVGSFSSISPHRRKNFFSTFLNVVVRVKKNGTGVASVVAALLASVGDQGGDEACEEMRTFCLSLIMNVPTSEQIHAMLNLLNHSNELLGDLVDAEIESFESNMPSDKFFDVGCGDLGKFAESVRAKKLLVVNILICLQALLGHPNFPLIIKNTKKAQVYLIQIWQRLLRLRGEIVLNEDEDKEDEFFTATHNSIMEGMLLLQGLVSMEHFLTITQVLVEDAGEGDEVLVKRSLTLLGERVKGVKKDEPEHLLVIEFVRDDLIKLVGGGSGVAMTALAVVVGSLEGVEEFDEVLKAGLKDVVKVLGGMEGGSGGGGGIGLAVETLLEKMGVKALPMLADLMAGAGVGKGEKSAAGLGVVRSVVRHMGAFLSQYLGTIMEEGWVDFGEGLADVLVEKVSLRVWCGVLEKSKAGVGGSAEEASVRLAILEKMVAKAGKKEVSGVFGPLVDVLEKGWGICVEEGGGEEGDRVREVCNDLLVSVVMKQSEKSLRMLVKRLEGIGGGLVFWSASARLANVLKSIFLPCFRVEAAVEVLEKFKGGSGKKRKREGDGKIVVLVLECVDSVLKADAFGGGGWCQAEEGRRFGLLLKELGRLLLEGGEEDIGESASRAMVSLAAAGGGEIMWKPLNHAVLECASFEGGKEVRLRGVRCLKNILEVVGEEYMGLLPECLPVLSELLEDENGDVVRLAKETLKVAEDLSGEDLGEYL
ncbi:hypothetical protein TrST_g5279 [Triparma strigata]|uniref:HEAT repeat-containing protein 1 n=1 Tax=Triparma strigata TaxID=1606541 RepID=A0A9W7F024_9STRA|nr:hypothetical protein TrST_g5279 [Triparma strigata]